MTLYLSSALSASVDVDLACRSYERLAATLRSRGVETYVPHLVTGPAHRSFSPADVFRIDMEAIYRCDGLLAVVDVPSHGVGAEIALALKAGVPTLAAHREGVQPSRFLAGLLEACEAPLVSYTTHDDLADQIACWALTDAALVT